MSLGLGAVLESDKFLEKEGLDVEWVKFSDVNHRCVRWLSTPSTWQLPRHRPARWPSSPKVLPIKIMLNTHIAEVVFRGARRIADQVARRHQRQEDRHVAAGQCDPFASAALLELNYGLKLADYTVVPGTEALLAQFLIQKQIDVAAVRSTTVAQMNELKLRRLGTSSEEWKKLTKSATPSYRP